MKGKKDNNNMKNKFTQQDIQDLKDIEERFTDYANKMVFVDDKVPLKEYNRVRYALARALDYLDPIRRESMNPPGVRIIKK